MLGLLPVRNMPNLGGPPIGVMRNCAAGSGLTIQGRRYYELQSYGLYTTEFERREKPETQDRETLLLL